MIRRRTPLVLALLSAGALALSGCGGAPEPVETTPLFASEDEAFAAAEETYRAYVDAVNSDRDNLEPAVSPRDYLTGAALQVDIETRSQLNQAGLSVRGASHLVRFEGLSASGDLVRALVCLDAADTWVLDRAGTDVTPANRVLITALEVAFVRSPKRGLLIEESTVRQDGECD